MDSFKCVKCNHGSQQTTQYCNGYVTLRQANTCSHGHHGEHLSVKCGFCGYRYNVLCADATEKVDG